MSRNVSIDEMGDAIMEELEKYSKLATDDLKAAVKETAASVRKDIQAGAPVDTGKYKKSWSVKICMRIHRALTLWCIRGTAIRWHTFWSMGMPSAAADVFRHSLISPQPNSAETKSSSIPSSRN
jgi:hypothetical protein